MKEYSYLSYKDLVNQLHSGVKPTYSQLLYTWEWVGFREGIKARDNFSCKLCGVTTVTEYTAAEKACLYEKLKNEIKQEPYIYFGSRDENEKLARDLENSLSDYDVLKRFGFLRISDYFTNADPGISVIM